MKNKIKKLNRKIPRKEAGRKVTINELALMIGKGFAGVDAKFAQVNERFNIGRGSYITLERGRKLANNVQVNEVAPDDIQS